MGLQQKINVLFLSLALMLSSGCVNTDVDESHATQQHVLVFGGTGRTGVEVVRELRRRGADVTVFVRPTSDRSPIETLGVNFVVGDATNADDVTAAMSSAEFTSVISTIGKRPGQEVRPDHTANSNIIRAATSLGVNRVIQLSAIGAGNSRQYVTDIPAFMNPVYEAKKNAEDELIASDLDYTIIRPGELGNGRPTGKAEITDDVSVVSFGINRADLADAMVRVLFDDSSIDKILHVYDPTLMYDRAALEAVLTGAHRTPAYRERDQYRHPLKTLEFFELRPDMHVVEIWPTAGWYTEIIAPYVRDQGQYYGAHFDSEHKSEFLRTQRAGFIAKLRDDPDVYGDARVTELGRGKYELAPPGSLDRVFTFRNVHNWTMSDYADDVFAGMYRALKPGGVLGIVDHRGEPHPPGDPEKETGYLRPDDVRALAERAGFVFEASSEVNANTADSKDHPQGVWTLPPSLRLGPKDYDKYIAIGESDRMTLRFRKPDAQAEATQ